MRSVLCFYYFYKKLIGILATISLLIGIISYLMQGSFSFKMVGLAYLISTPFIHFFVYEIGKPREYYFYYNMGMSKLQLWISSILTSLLIGIFLLLL